MTKDITTEPSCTTIGTVLDNCFEALDMCYVAANSCPVFCIIASCGVVGAVSAAMEYLSGTECCPEN